MGARFVGSNEARLRQHHSIGSNNRTATPSVAARRLSTVDVQKLHDRVIQRTATKPDFAAAWEFHAAFLARSDTHHSVKRERNEAESFTHGSTRRRTAIAVKVFVTEKRWKTSSVVAARPLGSSAGVSGSW
jgi:hypothetical protein